MVNYKKLSGPCGQGPVCTVHCYMLSACNSTWHIVGAQFLLLNKCVDNNSYFCFWRTFYKELHIYLFFNLLSVSITRTQTDSILSTIMCPAR